MKSIVYIKYLCILLTGLIISCATAPEFERNNENDPDSEFFIPDGPSIDGVTFEIDSLKNITFTWSPDEFVDGFRINKRYDTQSNFNELITIVCQDSVFIDSSKFFTEGTTYQLDFFRQVKDSLRAFTNDPIEITINFEPFSNIDFSYNENSDQLYIALHYSNNKSTLRYFDGIDVEINKSSLKEQWEPFVTYELDDTSVNQALNSFEISKTINFPVFDLNLRISQFVYDSSGTKKFLKTITQSQYIHTPDDVDFKFTDELNGNLTWRNSIFSFGGVILGGSVTDTIYSPSSSIGISFDSAPTLPIRISVQLFSGENYSAKDQSNARYPDVGAPYIEGLSVIDNQSFEFSWDTRSYKDYAGFIIEQNILPSTVYTAIDTVDKNTTSYTVNKLDQSKKYNFKVHSYTSEWSPAITVGYQNTFAISETASLSNYGYNLTYSKNKEYVARYIINDSFSYENGYIQIKNLITGSEYRLRIPRIEEDYRAVFRDFVVSEKNKTLIFLWDRDYVDIAYDYISVYDFINDEYIIENKDTPGNGGHELKLLNDDKTVIIALDDRLRVYDTETDQTIRDIFIVSDTWSFSPNKESIFVCSDLGVFEYSIETGEVVNQIDDLCYQSYVDEDAQLLIYIGVSSLKILDLKNFSVQQTYPNLEINDLDEITGFWFFPEDNLIIYNPDYTFEYQAYNIETNSNFLFSLPSYTENRGFGILQMRRNDDGTYSLTSYDSEFKLILTEGWNILEREPR